MAIALVDIVGSPTLTKNVLYLLSYVGLLHFINGGGRIRTHAARKGGRFTVCSD